MLEHEEKQERHKSGSAVMILLLLVVAISIGYAALTTTLIINGDSTINKATWDVHFANINVEPGSVVVDASKGEKPATITDTQTTMIDYSITLSTPGDFYEFTVDAVNSGTLDAAISVEPEITNISEYQKYLRYTVVWDDTGNAPAKNDIIKSKKSKKVRVRIEYRTDLNSSDLPTEDKVIDLKFSMNFIQAR